MEGNTLRDLVETHRYLARESSVYEDVRVDVEELSALLDVAEAADEFWVGANEVMTTSHHDDIGDSYDALHAALVRLAEFNVLPEKAGQ